MDAPAAAGHPRVFTGAAARYEWGRSKRFDCNRLTALAMRSPRHSVAVAVLGGMMAAAYLHSRGVVDLSYGFPPGGFLEGAAMAITGAVAGYAVLLVFRLLRAAGTGQKK